MTVKLVYFAWVRERIGKADEDLDLPENVQTVADLLNFLVERGEEYAEALKFPEAIRVALDQEHAHHSEKITGVREIGIFPPMTGG
jgi:sulfur-carrier protein